MAQPLVASMPQDVDLSDGYTVRFTALDPNTGAVVSGVKVSNMAMQVITLAGGQIPPTTGFTVTPLLQYTPGVT